MSHSSDRHKIQKRERTHRLNAKYGRHGHGGQGRSGHRGHAGRQFPQQRSVASTSMLADATIPHVSGGKGKTNDALRDAFNGSMARDAQLEHVGSTVWRNGPDGKRIRVTVINVQKAREYRDRQALKGILDEIDKREGLPSAYDVANARASQAPTSTVSSQGNHNGSMAARRQQNNINEIPITAQELAGEQILYEEQASSAMDDMRRHIDELHSTIARQSAMNRRNARASAKLERHGKTTLKRNGAISTAAIGDGGDAENAKKGGKAAIGKAGNGRMGGGSSRSKGSKGSKGNTGKPVQKLGKGGSNSSKRKPQRNARRLAGSMSAGSGGGTRGGSMPSGGAAGGMHGGRSQSQRAAARRQAIVRKRMDRIRQRIKFAQAVGNVRLVKRLQASLNSMTKRLSASQKKGHK